MNSERRTLLQVALTRLSGGDRSAIDPVFTLAKPAVQKFCEHWLNNAADAEDATQASLLRLFNQAHHFQKQRDALAWALEIAGWECRTIRKRQQRQKQVPIEGAAQMADERPSASEALETSQLQRAVAATCAELSAGDQAELQRVLSEQLAGDAAARKRRQRALERFVNVWRAFHADE